MLKDVRAGRNVAWVEDMNDPGGWFTINDCEVLPKKARMWVSVL